MKDNLITLDPFTQKEVIIKATNCYDKVINKLITKMGEEIFCTMDWQEIAQLFFYQGITNGALQTVLNDDFKETVSLMRDEIEFQKK